MRHRHGFTLFVLTLATLATAVLTGALSPRRLAWLPHGFERPVLALELVESDAAFTKIVDQRALAPAGKPAAPLFRNGTYADLAFIAVYGLLWVWIPLSCSPIKERRLVRYATVVAVGIAVLGDYAEDAGILMGFAGNLHADLIRVSALIKWAALGVAYLGMTWSFWPDHGCAKNGWQLWNNAIGLLYSYGGALCLLGVFASQPLIERVGLPIGAALVMQAFVFWHEHHHHSRHLAQRPPQAVAIT